MFSSLKVTGCLAEKGKFAQIFLSRVVLEADVKSSLRLRRGVLLASHSALSEWIFLFFQAKAFTFRHFLPFSATMCIWGWWYEEEKHFIEDNKRRKCARVPYVIHLFVFVNIGNEQSNRGGGGGEGCMWWGIVSLSVEVNLRRTSNGTRQKRMMKQATRVKAEKGYLQAY